MRGDQIIIRAQKINNSNKAAVILQDRRQIAICVENLVVSVAFLFS
jgi:hypothetical protein